MTGTVKRVLERRKGETVRDAIARARTLSWWPHVLRGPVHAGRAWVFIVRAA